MSRITHDWLLDALSYDAATGVFTANSDTGYRGRHKAGRVVGGIAPSGYWRIRLAGRLYQGHVLAWFYVHGEWPVAQVDHIDTVRHHNWIGNLRLATAAQNAQNRIRPAKNNRSGTLGVSWGGSNWVAYIKAGDQRKYLGSFQTKDDASAAYWAAKNVLHPFAGRAA